MKYAIRIFLLLISLNSYGQSKTTLPEEVVKSIKKRIEQEVNPSIAVGIIDKDGARYYNFGVTKKNGPFVNEHTIYEIGSISKVFTAILSAQQAADGKEQHIGQIRSTATFLNLQAVVTQ